MDRKSKKVFINFYRINSICNDLSAGLCLFFIVLFLFSCDKIKNPYVKSEGSTSLIKTRKVLIEEFTGHIDGHGVIVAKQITAQKNKYPGKAIAVAIHAGYFAQPFSVLYTADFHSPAGDDYYDSLNVTINPVVTVNRAGYPNNILMPYNAPWTDILDSIILLPADADIQVTNTYNSGSRQLNTSVRCEFLNSMNSTYKLLVLLTEDSIVSPQRDYTATPTDVPNYIHRYMLRDAISSTSWGDVIAVAPASGNTAVKTYTYTLPVQFNNTTPNENHCSVVAYLYDAATYEVIQAEEKSIK